MAQQLTCLPFKPADLNAIPETHKMKERPIPQKSWPLASAHPLWWAQAHIHTHTTHTHIFKKKQKQVYLPVGRNTPAITAPEKQHGVCGQPRNAGTPHLKKTKLTDAHRLLGSLPPYVQDLVLPCLPGRCGRSQTLIHNSLPSVSFPRWLHFSLKPLCWGKPSSVSLGWGCSSVKCLPNMEDPGS